MNKNIKVAKQLVKLAKNLIALDEEGDGSYFQILHDQANYEQDRLDKAQKEGKKYILHHKEGDLWRIQACKDFEYVKKGEFGGLIKSENNLSQEGDCWVYGDAKVFDNANVSGDAKVYDNANVYGDAKVYDIARVYSNAQVYGAAQVYNATQVYGNAKVSDEAQVFGKAWVFDGALVRGKTKIYDDAIVHDHAQVYGNAQVYENASVFDWAQVWGKSKIHGKAKVDYDVKDQEITE